MILQVFNTYLQMGGEEKSVERIRKHAQEAGIRVEKCFFDSADWQGNNAPSKFEQLRKLFYNYDSAKTLTRAILDHQPKALLVHNVYPVGSPAIYDVAKQYGVPIIQYVHNFRPFSVGLTLYAGGRYCPESLKGDFKREVLGGAWQNSVLKSFFMAGVLKRLQKSGWLDNVQAWICISDYMAEAFAEAGVPKHKLHVLRHSWDARAEENNSQDQGYYLFLSRLIEEKGVSVLIDAWERLARELGDTVPRLVIGGDGPMADQVRHWATTKTFVEYKGLVTGPQKTQLLAGCRAMLAPSVWKEPLGLVTYEAQDFSRPMFASASGGLAETTVHGQTGYLHQPGDASELMRQVVDFERMSTDQRQQIGKAARERILKDASPKKWQQDFVQVVEQVVGS